MKITRRKVLILNKHWQAIATCTVQRAIKLMFSVDRQGNPKALAVEEDFSLHDWNSWSRLPAEEDCIHTPNKKYKIPVIIIVRTEKMPVSYSAYNKTAVFKRDNYACMYCGVKVPKTHITIDHVVPRSMGGVNSWTNCVSCCQKCNVAKGSKTLDQSGMTLISKPYRPNFILCEDPHPRWLVFLGVINRQG